MSSFAPLICLTSALVVFQPASRQKDEVQVADPNGHVTTRTLDQRGQVLSTSDEVGSLGSVTRDANGFIVQSTSALGHQTSYTYDAKGNLFSTQDLLGLRSHVGKLCPVRAGIGDLVRNDQMILGVHSHLDIVANNAGAAPAGRHRT